MLDLELSFDDRALSAFNVSVSKIFENQEKALLWLLGDKPFRIEKIGNIFVIVPRDNQQHNGLPVSFIKTEKELFVFNGKVVSQTTGEPLEYAVVSFLDTDSQLLINAITNNMGQFTVQTPYIPAKIKIGYLGYENLMRNIHYLKGDLGIFQLTESVIQLDETVITADKIKSAINRTTYTITPKMQDGIDNALDLLNNIQGAYFDESSKSLFLNHQTNVLLMVDGIQHSSAYLKHLSSHRIQAIEVIHSLSGQFVSDNYAGIINFILKKDYIGYDISVLNNTSLNISKSAINNRLTKNNPSMGLVFSSRKLNFFGAYEYDLENSYVHSSKLLFYKNYEPIVNRSNSPNNLYEYLNHTVNGGLNYNITPLQYLGIQADFTSGNTSTFQKDFVSQTFSNVVFNDRDLTITTENHIKAYSFTGALFYRGRVTNRLLLNGDFSYNYYYNDMKNEHIQEAESRYRYIDLWNEYKNQTVFNLNGEYILSDRMSVEAGYSNIFRQYASSSSQGSGFLLYNEYRNKVYAYLSCYLSDKTELKLGAAPEFIRLQNGDEEIKNLRLLPYLHINHQISSMVNLSTGYATNQSYPSLYQLSPMSIVVDTLLTQIGNPSLISSVRHHVFVELSLWNKLKIMPRFNYIKDGVSEVYSMRENNLYRTFGNVNFREYNLHASYNQMLGAHFKLKNSVMFYRSEAFHEDIHSAVNGWTLNVEGDYYNSNAAFGVQLGYYRRMKKNILLQGYQMSDRDYWSVTARKELIKNVYLLCYRIFHLFHLG
jgi:hypothetical protein